MATQELGQKIGFDVAAVDLTLKQFHAVKMTATGWDIAGNGEQVDGILQNNPDVGESATVALHGRSKFVASGALAKGATVSSNAAGKGKVSASGNYILGKITEASGSDGDVVSVLITRPGRLA